MVELRLISGPSPRFELVNAANFDEYIYTIHIHTIKGTYSLSNPRPDANDTIVRTHIYTMLDANNSSPFQQCLWIMHDVIQLGDHWENRFVAFHPVKHMWIYMGQEYDAKILEQIENETIAWVKGQSPKMDQLRKAYEEDRESVHETFEHFECIIKNVHDPNTSVERQNVCVGGRD